MDAGEPQSGTALLDGPEPFTVDSDTTPTRPWRTTLRRQFMPLPVAGLLWCAAEVVHAAPETWPVGAPAAAAVYFIAAVGFWTSWAAEHPETRAQRRRWATTLIMSGGAWLLWAATSGPSEFTTLLLAGGGAALMLPYWTRNSPWQPEVAAAVESPEEPESELAEIPDVIDARTATQQFWDTVVTATVTALRGTYLVEPLLTDDYEQYTIQLMGGTQTTGTAKAATENVASAFGRGLDTVSILPYPNGAQDKAVLRLAKANPLQGVRAYPGTAQAIDLTGGNIRVLAGYRGNGQPVWWTYYEAGFGAKGGAVFGDTGSGKTELLISLITSAAHTGLIVPVVGCPQGKSFPLWRKHAHWGASTPAEVLAQARSLMEAHLTRAAINDLRDRDVHIPTRDEPVIIWYVDEIHTMAEHAEGPEFYALADALDRAGRATCIRLLAADQDPSVPGTFGNMPTLRRSLLASQCATLRLGGNVSSMVPNMMIDPSTLPACFPDGSTSAGLGVMVGEAEPFRAARILNAEALVASAPALSIEKHVAARMGPDYTERLTRKLAQRAERMAEYSESNPELLAELLASNPELADAFPKVQADRARRKADAASAAPRAQAPVFAELKVPAVPTFELITTPVTPTVQDRPATPGWTCVERIHDLLRNGVTQFGELAAEARKPDGGRYSETAIRNALRQLITDGRARDAGYGHYETTAA